MEAIEEGGSSRAGRSDEDDNNTDEEEDNNIFLTPFSDFSKMKASRPASIEVLDNIIINNTPKGVFKVLNQTELKFSRDNLRKIEEKLICAFVEFHRKLWYLKSYRCVSFIFFDLRSIR